MFYLLVAFPLLLIYLVLLLLTDLRGKILCYSMLPAGIVLLAYYIISLIRPGFLARLMLKPESDRQSS